MPKTIRIKRGLDIPLAGKASGRIVEVAPKAIGMVPDDFPGHAWKCVVKAGDEVKCGSPLLMDKETGLIKIVSPIEGTVKAIHRGERRKIEAVEVTPSPKQANTFKLDESAQSSEAIRATLLETGLWAMMRQRPFDIVPAHDVEIRDCFITAFDTAPLSPELFDKSEVEAIEKGLEILTVLTGKKPYISVAAKHGLSFTHGETISFEGPHPAGNVGVQIASVAPVNKGDVVLTLNVRTLIRIGRLFLSGVSDWKEIVAITGPEVKDPHLVETVVGCDLESLLSNNLSKPANEVRIISGNVLTGIKEELETGFLRYPYYQITVIEEGDRADEFMGWASMSPKKYSVKRTFPAFFSGLSKAFPFDARVKGGRRAMILSGEFDKVFPFDIYPEYLLKAIMSGDIDKMEKLGIYEVAPEDFALPEFVDTSKQELQKIVREGLDKVRLEG